jgi:centromere protein J
MFYKEKLGNKGSDGNKVSNTNSELPEKVQEMLNEKMKILDEEIEKFKRENEKVNKMKRECDGQLKKFNQEVRQYEQKKTQEIE